MFSEEEEYNKKNEELNKILSDPAKAKKIEGYLKKISKITNCDVEITFSVSPYVDNYMDQQDSDEYALPNASTMKMGEVIKFLSKEDDDFDVYIDPIYLSKGVNEIIDILITTKENKVVVVPVPNKKQIKF